MKNLLVPIPCLVSQTGRLRLSIWGYWDVRVPRVLPICPHWMDTWGGQGWGQHRPRLGTENRWHLVVSLRPLGLTR